MTKFAKCGKKGVRYEYAKTNCVNGLRLSFFWCKLILVDTIRASNRVCLELGPLLVRDKKYSFRLTFSSNPCDLRHNFLNRYCQACLQLLTYF